MNKGAGSSRAYIPDSVNIAKAKVSFDINFISLVSTICKFYMKGLMASTYQSRVKLKFETSQLSYFEVV